MDALRKQKQQRLPSIGSSAPIRSALRAARRPRPRKRPRKRRQPRRPWRSTGSQRRSRARTSVRTCLRARPRGSQRKVHLASRSSRRPTSTVRSADGRTRVLTRAAALSNGLAAHPALRRRFGDCLLVASCVSHSQPRLLFSVFFVGFFVCFGRARSHFAAWRLWMACRARGQPPAAQVPRERPQARARAGGERTSLARTTARVFLPQCRRHLYSTLSTAEYRGVRTLPRMYHPLPHSFGGGQYRTAPQSSARYGRHGVSVRIDCLRYAEACSRSGYVQTHAHTGACTLTPTHPHAHTLSPTHTPTHPLAHTFTDARAHTRARAHRN